MHSKRNLQQNQQSSECEKIFANHISDKELISKSIRNPYHLTAKNNLVKKWPEGLSRHYLKKKIRMSKDTCKGVQHQYSLGKYISKPQCEILPHTS